jgi:hypothetical protein
MYKRPIYRPQAPAKRRRGRSCRCSFCWALLVGRHPPSSTTAPVLTDAITLTVTARIPNTKMVYLYNDLTLSVATAANAVPLGTATLPGFTHGAGNASAQRGEKEKVKKKTPNQRKAGLPYQQQGETPTDPRDGADGEGRRGQGGGREVGWIWMTACSCSPPRPRGLGWWPFILRPVSVGFRIQFLTHPYFGNSAEEFHPH